VLDFIIAINKNFRNLKIPVFLRIDIALSKNQTTTSMKLNHVGYNQSDKFGYQFIYRQLR